MIDFIISLLQKCKTRKLKKFFGGLYLIGIIIITIIFIYQGIDDKGVLTEGIYIVILCISLVSAITSIYLVIKRHLEGVVDYVYLVYFPLIFIILKIYNNPDLIDMFSFLYNSELTRQLFFFTLYPLCILIKIRWKEPNKRWFHKVETWSAELHIGLLAFLTISIIRYIIGGVDTYLPIWQLIIFSTAPIIGLNLMLKRITWNRLRALARGILFVFIARMFQFVSDWQQQFYTHVIQRAETRLQDDGLNEQSYGKINYNLLKRAYLYKFKRNSRTNTTYFQKIFDTTPEIFYGEKLAQYREKHDTTRSNTFGTNASKVGKEANVVLTLADIKNTIITQESDIPIMETSYDLWFRNTVDENQEVIIHFEVANPHTIIYEMLLGINGEYEGQIAPRGAAKKVYEDSLRRNIDPALLEKVGANTYALRIFPIPRKTDSKTQGKQRIQLSLRTVIQDTTDSLSYTPKFSFINLNYDKKSKLVAKVYVDGALKKEEVFNEEEVLTELQQAKTIAPREFGVKASKGIFDYCLPKQFTIALGTNDLITTLLGTSKNLEGYSIFVDNSLSASRNNTDSMYAEIFKQIKNYQGNLQDTDLYSFNFEVQKIANIEDIAYRGYSDIDSVLDFIEDNNIKKRYIIILTDDDSYNYSTTEDKSRNYTALLSNKISIINIGDSIKRYKSDVTNIIAATRGDVYSITQPKNILDVIDAIHTTNESFSPSNCESLPEDSKIRSIMGGIMSNNILSSVQDEKDWLTVAEFQNAIASTYHIVNQFNAMIALENERQQRDLERYSQQNDKFDTKLDLFDKTVNNTNNNWLRDIRRPQSAADGEGSNAYYVDIGIVARGSGVGVPQKKKGFLYASPHANSSPGIGTLLQWGIFYLIHLMQIIYLIKLLLSRQQHDEDDDTYNENDKVE